MEPSLEQAVLSPHFPASEGSCALCLNAPARYTCPRCNAPYCSLSCYRGGRHHGCSEAFYRGEVLRGLQEAGAVEKGDIEKILTREREAQLQAEGLQGLGEDAENGEKELWVEEGAAPEDEAQEAECSLDEERLDPQTLWQKLTPEEQQDFERLLENGGLGSLLQPWHPWWESHEGTLLVQEVGQMHEELLQQHNMAMMTLEQRSKEGSVEPKERVKLPKVRQGEGKLQSTKSTDEIILQGSQRKIQKDSAALHQKDRVVNSKCFQADVIHARTENCGSAILSPPTPENIVSPLVELEQSTGLLPQAQTQIVFAKEEKTESTERLFNKDSLEVLPTTTQTPVPHVRLNIPPLHSLTRNPSSLVRFNLVNILYAYAFSLKLYNGDLGEDFILQEFCNTVLAVSAALSSKRVFDSTAEALQAGIQALLTMGIHGDPHGAALAVGHILLGVSQGGRKNYTLAALSHLADILLKTRRLAPKDKKHLLFNAKKKCDFLLSWVNEHEDALTHLSVEVQSEYKRYTTSLKEVECITLELEKSWGGNKPPQKKVLIYELD